MNTSPHSDASRERKRRKTQRACDHCRSKKLRCEYPTDLNDPVCNNCRDAGRDCAFVAPAKIDKRRLQVLMERAVTEDDKTKLALEVAQRGVYTAKDESETLLKPLELVVGSVISRAPPGSGSAGVSAGPSTASFVDSSNGNSVRRPRSSNGFHAGPSNGMAPKRERSPERYDHGQAVSRRPYASMQGSAPLSDRASMRDRQWVDPNGLSYPQGRPSHLSIPSANAEASSSSSISHASSTIPSMAPPPRPAYTSSRTEPRMLGPTAITNLLTEMKGKTDISNHDERFGLIRLDDEHTYYGDPPDPFSDQDLAQHTMADSVKNSLALFYADKIAVLHPVILPAQARRWRQLDPALQYAIFGVSALNRNTPLPFVIEIRRKLDALLMEGVERTSSLANIQAMLITAMSHELHGRTCADAGSIVWIRAGAAIRQAQDIGLDVTSASSWTNDILADRSRVWLSCLVTDRWYGITYGHPAMVNLDDIEDPLRHEYIHQDDTGVHEYQRQLYKVSCITGRVIRALYRPRGLANTSDEELQGIQVALDDFLAELPTHLQFHGPHSSSQAVVLGLLLIITEVLLFRNFLDKNRKSVPSHIGWRPTCPRWYECSLRARSLIAWMDTDGDIILDSWCIGKAAMGYAALAQYYHYSDDRKPECLKALRTAENLMHRWACGHNAEVPTAFRAKVAEIVRLIHRAAKALSSRPLSGSQAEDGIHQQNAAANADGFYPDYQAPVAPNNPYDTPYQSPHQAVANSYDRTQPHTQGFVTDFNPVYNDGMPDLLGQAGTATAPFPFWPGDGLTTSDDFLYKFYNHQIPDNMRMAPEQLNSKDLDGDQVTLPSHLLTSRTDWGGAFQ